MYKDVKQVDVWMPFGIFTCAKVYDYGRYSSGE